ncbi:HNH endonuclease [Rhodococcus pyridinivorans]|uniref:HNH endonuclease n=1 Tax=Rhodococcus pyridinivorans TaxID=103816 RepID=UPI003AAB6FAB
MAWARKSHTRHVPHAVQRACFRRDDYTCVRCGHRGEGRGDLHAGHVIADADGGPATLGNLVTLCVPCHADETTADNRARAQARAARRRLPPTRHPGYL